MLKKILQYSVKSRCCAPISISGISLQNKEMSYSLWLPYKHCIHENNFQLLSSVFNFFYKFNWKYSHVVATNEVENLCDFLLSQDSVNWETERIEELKNMFSFLLSKGYSSKDIKEKFLIHLKSSDCSYAKLRILSNIDTDLFLLLPLLSLPITLLHLVAKNAKIDKSYAKEFSNRIKYLSYHLELEPAQLIQVLTKHPSLLTLRFNKLHAKMNILKDGNISPKYIVKDLWIFNYNEQMLANRIQAALKAGIKLKPWMLRCSENFFEAILIKHAETQRILGNETLQSYLAKRLDCSIEYVNYLMEKNKLLKTINIPKLEQVLNVLFEKGYTAEEIRLFPRIFSSSLQTLEKRIEEFQQIKSTIPTLAELCLSTKRLQSKIMGKKR